MKRLNFLTIILFAATFLSCKETEAMPAIMLKTDTEQLDFEASGGTQSITVQANRAFTATPQAEWCVTEKISAASNNLKISVRQNSGEVRTTDIILSAAGAADIKVAVRQAKAADLPAARVASKVMLSSEGKKYLEVDSKPYFFSNVQAMGTSHLYGHSWGNEAYAQPLPVSWLENMFEKTSAAGYKTIAVMLYWRDIEPQVQGTYDWNVIDKYIDWCNKYDMHLEIIWYGHNTVGGVRLQGYLNSWYPQIPQYLQNHDKYWNNGDTQSANDIHRAFLPSANQDAANLHRWEREAMHNLFNHLSVYDVQNRTIAIQLLNEPDPHPQFNTEEYRQQVVNKLGEAVKTSRYVVATCVNFIDINRAAAINALPNIDFTGHDPYTEDPDVIKTSLNIVSGMPYIAENDGKVANMSKLMITALVNGGSYNTWHLNNHWSDQGIYDPAAQDYKNWTLGQIPALRPGAQATKRLLTGINKIGSIVAAAPPARMAGFNIYNQTEYNETMTKGNYQIGFATATGAAGMAVMDNNAVYLLHDASNPIKFTINVQPKSVSDGYMDANGNWVEVSQKTPASVSGKYEITVNMEECVRITF